MQNEIYFIFRKRCLPTASLVSCGVATFFTVCASTIIFLLNSTKKRQRDAGVFDCFAYGEIDTPYSCPSSSYVSKILLAFLLRYRKQTAFFEHTLQFGSIKLCECTIFFAGKCSHYTGCFTGSHQGGLYAE